MTTIAPVVDRSHAAFMQPSSAAARSSAPLAAALNQAEAALLAKSAAESHERVELRVRPELRDPEPTPMERPAAKEQVVRLVSNLADDGAASDQIGEASFERHQALLREKSQETVTPTDKRFESIVQMMVAQLHLARIEREQRSSANQLYIEVTKQAGELRVQGAVMAFGAAIASGAVQLGIGVAAVGQTVKSVNITSASVKQNVARANRVDVTTRNNQQTANLGANKAAVRPERTVQTADGKQVKLPSDTAADTPAMRGVAESQAMSPEVATANMEHTLASAKAQVPYVTGSMLNMFAPTANGVGNGAGQVASAEQNRLADLRVATAELHHATANERGEQVSHAVSLQQAALDLLQSMNSSSAMTSNQIIGNM